MNGHDDNWYERRRNVQRAIEEDQAIFEGAKVVVRWGYGLGFRAEAKGTIVKVFAKSFRVRLDEDVSDPYTPSKCGWKLGTVLHGIPRFASNNWHPEHCVVAQEAAS